MLSGDSYQNGEENNPPDPRRVERGVQAEQANRVAEPAGRGGGSSSRTVSGFGSGSGEDEVVDGWQERRRMAEENGGEPSGGEQGQEDVEMNGGPEGSVDGSIQHSSGSTTGSDSTKR